MQLGGVDEGESRQSANEQRKTLSAVEHDVGEHVEDATAEPILPQRVVVGGIPKVGKGGRGEDRLSLACGAGSILKSQSQTENTLAA